MGSGFDSGSTNMGAPQNLSLKAAPDKSLTDINKYFDKLTSCASKEKQGRIL